MPSERTRRCTPSRPMVSAAVEAPLPTGSFSPASSVALRTQERNTWRNSSVSPSENRSSCITFRTFFSSALSSSVRSIRMSCTKAQNLTSAEPCSLTSSTPASRANSRAMSSLLMSSCCSSRVLGSQPNSLRMPCNSLLSIVLLWSLSNLWKIVSNSSNSTSENPAFFRSLATNELLQESTMSTKSSKDRSPVCGYSGNGASLPNASKTSSNIFNGNEPVDLSLFFSKAFFTRSSSFSRYNLMRRRNSRKSSCPLPLASTCETSSRISSKFTL
mmetsp:Transcript_63093/g.160118  ORF Transcript_63093/g.160118 Transcript_63093/m.160118 type:complete len:273 (-) Transcript_63093:913-1731(-)